jgi:hypothetical protein
MDQELIVSLQQQDDLNAQKEAKLWKEIQRIREVRKAYAVVIANSSGGGMEDQDATPAIGVTERIVETKQARPRRGWTKIIRDVLTVHPGITFKQLIDYALEAGKEPDGAPDFEKRMRYALRDMTSKGFTIRTKGERKSLSTYVLNPNK